MKKILSLLLSAVIAVSGTSIPVSAADSPVWLNADSSIEATGEITLYGDDITAAPGQTVEWTLNLKNNPGFTSLGLAVNMPSAVSAIKDSNGNVECDKFWNLTTAVLDRGDGRIGIATLGSKPYTDDGPAIKLYLHISEDAVAGETYPITLELNKMLDGQLNDFTESVVLMDSSITIVGSGQTDPIPTSGVCGDDLTWTLDTDTKTLTISGTGEMWDRDYTKTVVLQEDPGWYFPSEGVEHVIIEDGVTNISNGIFAMFTDLITISIPDSVKSIGEQAFINCVNLMPVELAGDVVVAENACLPIANRSVTTTAETTTTTTTTTTVTTATDSEPTDSLSWFLYNGYLNVSGEDDMVDYDESEHQPPFYSERYSVEYIEVEEGVRSIGEYAFCSCPRLHAVVLPKSVKRIGSGAFDGSINAVFMIQNPDCEIAPDTEEAKTLGSVKTIFGYAGSTAEAYAKEHNIPFYLLDTPNATETDVTWSMNADGVLTIGGKGRMRSYNAVEPSPFASALVKKIVIQDGITAIGSQCFSGCNNAESVSIPQSVTYIGGGAFSDCTMLQTVTFPENLQYIGWNAFQNCRSLNDVTIPESVRFLEADAFSFCESLTDVTLPESLLKDAYYAFKNITPFGSTLEEPQTDNTSGRCGENLTWTLSADGTLTITGTGELSNVGIDWENHWGAEAVKHLVISDGVTSIGENAFSDCENLTSVTIPDNVTSIGDYAFFNCENLTSVTIPDGVTSIGSGAFENCRSLTAVTIPDGVTSIGDYAFAWCSGLTSIAIPDSVTSIGENAFYNCVDLTSVTIPDGLTSIGYEAFYNCENLTSVTIPDSVTSIEDYAFESCSSLTSVTIPDGVTSIGDCAFSDCENLTSVTIPENVQYFAGTFQNTPWWDTQKEQPYIQVGDVLLYVRDDTKTFTIPDGVTSIGYGAFENCRSLTAVTIPDSVTSIEENAFSNCENLTSVTLPSHLALDALKAFRVTPWLENQYTESGTLIINNALLDVRLDEDVTSFTIPDGVTSIGDKAFYNCSSLTSVEIPDSVETIGYGAFDGTAWLEELKQQDHLVIVNDILLDGSTCSGVVDIPDGVRVIAPNAFVNAVGVTEVTIPETVTKIGDYAFGDGDVSEVMESKPLVNLKKITIKGNGLKTIGYAAFSDLASLTELRLPDSVEEIGECAFQNSAISRINIPASLKNLNSAFSALYIGGMVLPDGLESVSAGLTGSYAVVPKSVKTLVNPGFVSVEEAPGWMLWLNAVKDIYYLGTEAEWKQVSVTVDESIGAHEYFFSASDLRKIEEMKKGGGFADDVTIHYNCEVKTVDGITYIIADGEAIVASCPADAKTVTIPEDIDSIPVAAIGAGAFVQCSALESISIPASVKCIGEDAFDGCAELQSITLPAAVELPIVGIVPNTDRYAATETIEHNGVEDLFDDCKTLTEVLFDGESEKYISYDGVVYDKETKELLYCPEGKTSIDFLAGVSAIGVYAMESIQMTELTIPVGVKTIRQFAFASSKLQSIVLSEGPTVLCNNAFGGCTDLSHIELPTSLLEIQEEAFYNCPKLKEIEIPASVAELWLGDPEEYMGFEQRFSIFSIPCTHDSYDGYTDTYYVDNPVLVIKCYEDTAAERYAADADIVFENIGKKPLVGDLNADTTVSIADAVLLSRIVNEDSPDDYDKTVFKYADLNHDGMYTMTDILMLMRMIQK